MSQYPHIMQVVGDEAMLLGLQGNRGMMDDGCVRIRRA